MHPSALAARVKSSSPPVMNGRAAWRCPAQTVYQALGDCSGLRAHRSTFSPCVVWKLGVSSFMSSTATVQFFGRAGAASVGCTPLPLSSRCQSTAAAGSMMTWLLLSQHSVPWMRSMACLWAAPMGSRWSRTTCRRVVGVAEHFNAPFTVLVHLAVCLYIAVSTTCCSCSQEYSVPGLYLTAMGSGLLVSAISDSRSAFSCCCNASSS